ncbi:flippase, partial [Vibrio campbellii]
MIKIKNQVIENILYLFFDKIIKLLLYGILIVSITRYLGPERFGIYSYSLAIIMILSSVSTLGLKGIVIREVIKRSESSSLLLSQSIILITAFTSFLYFLTVLFAQTQGREEVKIALILLGIVLIFKSSEVVRYYFEAKIKSKKCVIIDTLVNLIFTSLKLCFIYFDFGFNYLLALFSFEYLIHGMLILSLVKKESITIDLTFNKVESLYLIKSSWPLIISSASWVIYTKMDQLMVKNILGFESSGLYSSAIQLSEFLVFIPTIIAFSIIPKIESYTNESSKTSSYQSLYNLVTGISLLMSLLLTFFSEEIIVILYGNEYIEASKVLVISSWSLVFFSFAIVSGQYLVYRDLQKITMYRHLFGLVLNGVLNYFLLIHVGVE